MSELITFFRSLHLGLSPHQILVSEAYPTVLDASCVTTAQPSAFKIHQFIAANLCIFNRLSSEESQTVAVGIENLRVIFEDDSIGAIVLPLLNNAYFASKPKGCSTVICLNPIMSAGLDADLSYQMGLLEDCVCKDGVIQSYSFLSELLTESDQYSSRVCEVLGKLFTYQSVTLSFPELLELLQLLKDKEELDAFKIIIWECRKILSECGAFVNCKVEELEPFLRDPNNSAHILLSWSLYNQLPIPSRYLEKICLELIDPELKDLLMHQYPFVNFKKEGMINRNNCILSYTHNLYNLYFSTLNTDLIGIRPLEILVHKTNHVVKIVNFNKELLTCRAGNKTFCIEGFSFKKIVTQHLKIFKRSLSRSQNTPFTKLFKKYPSNYSTSLNLPFLDCTIQHKSGKIRVGRLKLFGLDYFRSMAQQLFKNNCPLTFNLEDFSETTIKALLEYMEKKNLPGFERINVAEFYTLADYLCYDGLRMHLKSQIFKSITLQNLPILLAVKPASFRHYCLAMARKNIRHINLKALPEDTFLEILLHPRRSTSDYETYEYLREWYSHHNRSFPIVYLLPAVRIGNGITPYTSEDGRKIIHFQLYKTGATIKFRRDFNYQILNQVDDIGVYPEDIEVIKELRQIKLPKFNVETSMSFRIEVNDEMPRMDDITISYHSENHLRPKISSPLKLKGIWSPAIFS